MYCQTVLDGEGGVPAWQRRVPEEGLHVGYKGLEGVGEVIEEGEHLVGGKLSLSHCKAHQVYSEVPPYGRWVHGGA